MQLRVIPTIYKLLYDMCRTSSCREPNQIPFRCNLPHWTFLSQKVSVRAVSAIQLRIYYRYTARPPWNHRCIQPHTTACTLKADVSSNIDKESIGWAARAHRLETSIVMVAFHI
jgi:hypothetical protein